ncbi:MAG TPA: hypothetical protein VD907_04075 [Verrucomicrobiae bacterium]|nr:hypothetical protein [Verrucomicrobiae bacterium]
MAKLSIEDQIARKLTNGSAWLDEALLDNVERELRSRLSGPAYTLASIVLKELYNNGFVPRKRAFSLLASGNAVALRIATPEVYAVLVSPDQPAAWLLTEVTDTQAEQVLSEAEKIFRHRNTDQAIKQIVTRFIQKVLIADFGFVEMPVSKVNLEQETPVRGSLEWGGMPFSCREWE